VICFLKGRIAGVSLNVQLTNKTIHLHVHITSARAKSTTWTACLLRDPCFLSDPRRWPPCKVLDAQEATSPGSKETSPKCSQPHHWQTACVLIGYMRGAIRSISRRFLPYLGSWHVRAPYESPSVVLYPGKCLQHRHEPPFMAPRTSSTMNPPWGINPSSPTHASPNFMCNKCNPI
jgi:hypothetical protein